MRRRSGNATSEGEFFYRLDAELIETMRKRAELEQQQQHAAEVSRRTIAEQEKERLQMADVTRIRDPDFLFALQCLGYQPATASLLWLAPLVQVAWADGKVSRAERNHVIAIADQRGVETDSPAHDQLLLWLERQPRDKVFHDSWCALRVLLDSLSPDDRRANKDWLMKECKTVAAVSGRVFKRICEAEHRLLDRMEEELKAQLQGGVPAADAGRQTCESRSH